MPGWVYIMTNRPNGTLYVGVTDNLARRAWEHHAGLVDGFTSCLTGSIAFAVSCRTLDAFGAERVAAERGNAAVAAVWIAARIRA